MFGGKYCKDFKPKLSLDGKIIKFVDSVKYLGVFLTDTLSDDFDIARQVKYLYAVGSSLRSKFQKCSIHQRWSRGHKARGQGQGHKKNPRPRPRTAFPRTDTLEAKAKDQGHKRKCSQKKSSQKFFKRSPQKNVFQIIFQALLRILTIQKIVLSSSRGQANFRGLEASKPRPRTSKCVLEDVLEAKDVLEHSTSAIHIKNVLFRAHCCTLCVNQLWCCYTYESYRRLRVSYNDSFCSIHDISRYCSVYQYQIEAIMSILLMPLFANFYSAI